MREEGRRIRKHAVALALGLFVILSLATVHANPNTTRDTDSTQGASVPTTGTRLSMYRGFALGSCSFSDPNVAPGATTFPANTAFFVRHGWIAFLKSLSGKDQGAFLGSVTDFELYVDGVEQRALPDFFNSQGGDFYTKLFVFNFGNGMTGTHTFVGWWFEDAGLEGGTYGQQLFALGCALSITFA